MGGEDGVVLGVLVAGDAQLLAGRHEREGAEERALYAGSVVVDGLGGHGDVVDAAVLDARGG